MGNDKLCKSNNVTVVGIVITFVVAALLAVFGVALYSQNATLTAKPSTQVSALPSVAVPVVDDRLQFICGWIRSNHCQLPPSVINDIAEAIIRNSDKWNIPFEIIMALIEVESEYKVRAVSHANCKGLMQIDAVAHKEEMAAANIRDPFNIYDNIYMGCLILDQKMKESDRGIVEAINRYNACTNGEFYRNVLIMYAKIKLNEEY